MPSMKPQPNFSVPGSSFGFGLVATRYQAKFTSMATPQRIASTLTSMPQRPRLNSPFSCGQPLRRTLKIASVANR